MLIDVAKHFPGTQSYPSIYDKVLRRETRMLSIREEDLPRERAPHRKCDAMNKFGSPPVARKPRRSSESEESNVSEACY